MMISKAKIMKFAVVGSGKFGRELTKILLNNHHEVLIYSRRIQEIESITNDSKSLSGFVFPNSKNLTATTDLKDLADVKYIFLTFSSKDISFMLNKIPVTDQQIFISCIKGFENNLGVLPSEMLIEKFGVKKENLIVLSGPNLSREIAKKELTATVLAGENKKAMNEVAESLKNEFFIPFINTDRYGVELAGALKNIYAIVSGYFHAKGVGENTIGFLLTKSLEEIRVFSEARGANSSTFLGLAGVGDFFSTALSKDSRNYKFGEMLATGLDATEALAKINDTVEGYQTSLAVHKKSLELGLNLSILNFLIELYDAEKSLDEASKILVPDGIDNDIRTY